MSRSPFWTMLTGRVIVFSLSMTLYGCGTKDESASRLSEASAAAPCLTDVTERVGLRSESKPDDISDYELPRIMGVGGGLFDYDGDGDLDVLLIGVGPWPPGSSKLSNSSRLFRQDETGHFVDVTAASGLANSDYGMGLAIGDTDNDGDLDVFFTNYGEDRFFVNRGDGTFFDHTAAAGVSDPNWSTAAAFFDYDRDGWLDLVVVNYVDYFASTPCFDRGQRRDFCGPQAFQGTVTRLYRNRGLHTDSDGPRFEDVTVVSGLATAIGRGLGVSCADFNGDRRPDIFVANDMEPNRLWIQQAQGMFVDEAPLRGVAVNHWGQAEANMGVLFDELTGDTRPDLFVTHLRGESNTLWRGEEDGFFLDVTAETGLGAPSLPATGFGVVALDLEHDGDLDVVVVNGHVKRPGLSPRSGQTTNSPWQDYADANQIYEQQNAGRFRLVLSSSESFTQSLDISRGLSMGDVDLDGDQDLLVTNCHGAARLYFNTAPKRGSWLQLRLWDTARRRDAYGARVRVEAEGRSWRRMLQPSGSYLSHHDVWLHFGLGSATRVERIIVDWPDGEPRSEVFPGGAADRRVELRRGEGQFLEKRE